MVTQPLVEASDKRDLSADGGGHRLSSYFAGQPIMEDVDLLVVFGEPTCSRGPVGVCISRVSPHFKGDLGHSLDDASTERTHFCTYVRDRPLGDVFGQITASLELGQDQEDTNEMAQRRAGCASTSSKGQTKSSTSEVRSSTD